MSPKALITVTRTLGALGDISVSYRTFDVTASNGVQYVGVTNVLSWGSLDFSPRTFFVSLIPNGIVEGATVAGLELFNPIGGGTFGLRANTTLTNLGDDKGPGKLGVLLAK